MTMINFVAMSERGNLQPQNENFFLTDVDNVSRTTQSVMRDVKNDASNVTTVEPEEDGTTINPLAGTVLDTLPIERRGN